MDNMTINEMRAQIIRLTHERNNAEKREYEVLGRADRLARELAATNKRLDKTDELLREERARSFPDDWNALGMEAYDDM